MCVNPSPCLLPSYKYTDPLWIPSNGCARVCVICNFHREVRKRVSVTHHCILAQQLWGCRPCRDVNVAMETVEWGGGASIKTVKGREEHDGVR